MAQDLIAFLDEFEKDPRIAPLLPAAREDVRRAFAAFDEAYLRGLPVMVRHSADGLDVEVIPADQFYLTPGTPSSKRK